MKITNSLGKRIATSTVAIAGIGAVLSMGIVNPAQGAAPAISKSDPTPIAISIGDSFISGEGGRYNGNKYSGYLSDGAVDTGDHATGMRSYEDSWGGQDFYADWFGWSNRWCHRSDSAEIKATKALGWTPVNLACSGAVASDVLTETYRSEKPQVQRLNDLAGNKNYDIKNITVSIGGNDLEFSSILTEATQISSYHDAEKDGIWKKREHKIPAVQAKITSTLNKISEVMRSNGYPDGSYRFVYQSYSNIFASSDNRIMSVDSNWQKNDKESPGVALSNATVDFSRSTMVPAITKMTQDAARAADNKSIQFMDLSDVLNGHELSNKQTYFSRSSEGGVPNAATAEWVVPLNSSYIAGGLGTHRQQESYHPNRYGQQAYGTCLVATLETNAAEVACTGIARHYPTDLVVRERGGKVKLAPEVEPKAISRAAYQGRLKERNEMLHSSYEHYRAKLVPYLREQ